MKTQLFALRRLTAGSVSLKPKKHVVDLDHWSIFLSAFMQGVKIDNRPRGLQVNLAMSLLVCGNFSNVLPVLRETSGCSFASLEVR